MTQHACWRHPNGSRRHFTTVLALALVSALAGACGGNGGQASSGASEGPVASGTFAVRGGGIYEDSPAGGCGGGLEYNRPYRGGLSVVVYDASGKVLGSGALENGTVDSRNDCVLPFEFSLSGTDDNYQIAFGGEKGVVQDITSVDVGIGPG